MMIRFCLYLNIWFTFLSEYKSFLTYSKLYPKQYFQLSTAPKSILENAYLDTTYLSNALIDNSIQRFQHNVVILGSGPAGLATAIMFARRGFKDIVLYDRLGVPPTPNNETHWTKLDSERSYNIGLGGRGQVVLQKLQVMDRIDKYIAEVIGRRDWNPNSSVNKPVETYFQGRTFPTKCLERDRLAACLIEEIDEKYLHLIRMEFNTECKGLKWENFGRSNERSVAHLVSKDKNMDFFVETPCLIGADGANSIVRDEFQQVANDPKNNYKFQIKTYDDNNVRVYRTIPIYFPDEKHSPSSSSSSSSDAATHSSTQSPSSSSNKKWRVDLNYSARTKSDLNFDALPTKEGIYLGVLLYRPWDNRIKQIKNSRDAKKLFEDHMPMFLPTLRDNELEKFAAKKDSNFPKFSYVGPVLHCGRSACLLGDSIHTVKPFFGLGVNSAFEDVWSLHRALEHCDNDVPKAIEMYSKDRAPQAKALVQMSRKFDGGFVSFVLPLIIDGIFHKSLPRVFGPNAIAMMQNEKFSFTQIKNRKRLDRILQLVTFGLIGGGTIRLVSFLTRLLLKVFLRQSPFPR